MLKKLPNIFASTGNNDQGTIEFTFLLQLRWGAILGQAILIILVGLYIHTPIPYPAVSTILIFQTISNFFFNYLNQQKRSVPAWLFAAIMFVDVGLLTLLLAKTGGTMNPFTFLYLLHIVMGAILMPPLWSWSLALFTIACYSSFFIQIQNFTPFGFAASSASSPEIICVDTLKAATDNETKMDQHLKGMLVAFSITSLFIVYFIGRIRTALHNHNEMLAQLKEQRLKNEKLASLATLSAGAAHEFSTPLSTIKLASGELLYTLKDQGGDESMIEDLLLIRHQIEKCEEIISQMSEDAGNFRGENFNLFTMQELLTDLMAEIPAHDHDSLNITPGLDTIELHAPFQILSRTIRGIIKNALDASAEELLPIEIKAWQDEQYTHISVRDYGTGMTPELIARASEPFFTTKEPGQGMGLGLFLARSIAERFSGKLDITSEENKGTEVIMTIKSKQS